MVAIIDDEDMVFHSLFIGSTGAGKTNALLYWLLRLFTDRKDVALVLIDPHGDAAIDLVRAIPKSERERITILDPTYVSFGLNPLSLPQGVELRDRVQVLQTQVEELSALLSDVFNTDAATAPRLMWIFKGALYYLYTLNDNPTFKDLYRILVDFISLPKEMIESDAQVEGPQGRDNQEHDRRHLQAPEGGIRPCGQQDIELRPPSPVDDLQDVLRPHEQARLRRDDQHRGGSRYSGSQSRCPTTSGG